MTRLRLHKTNRSAFTLVELLMVMAIIAILVSLVAAGLFKVMNQVGIVRTRTEISEMEAALAAFMQDYNLPNPPPSYLVLREDLAYNLTVPLEAQSLQFLKQAFGKNLGASGGIDWNGNGQIDTGVGMVLEGEQCLIFYLGGIPNTAAQLAGAPPQCLGFSTNNVKPSWGSMPVLGENPNGPRRGPYFNFQTGRLVPPTVVNPSFPANLASQTFFVYIDAWNVKVNTLGGTGMPYAYFSSFGNNNQYNIYTAVASLYAPLGQGDCESIGLKVGATMYSASAYYQALGSYTNPNKFQIISAGQDGVFGYDATMTVRGGVGWNPAQGAIGNGRDDQANFSSKVLGAGQQ